MGAWLLPIGGFILSFLARTFLWSLIRRFFSKVAGRVLDRPMSGTTASSGGAPFTLRQILNGNLGHGTGTEADPAARIKVLEDLHAQGGLTAAKLAKLKAAIAAGD